MACSPAVVLVLGTAGANLRTQRPFSEDDVSGHGSGVRIGK
jgi:hypothetical protein